jgi:hypothetical protein
VPTILRKGADWFAKLGVANAGGTAIFSVSGHVNKPGNYELPMGIPFAELLEIAGGVRNGNKLKAVIPAARRCTCCRRQDHGREHGLRLAEGRGFVGGFGRGHRHGRDHLHGEGARAPVALLQE